MLGRLKMDVDECIDSYSKLSSKAFTRKAYLPFTMAGNIHERFDSKQLELALKQVIVDRGYDQETLLKDPDTSCRVVLCATRGETCSIACLRSYPNARDCSELYNTTTIWQAGRATSAASSFFDPVTIGAYGLKFFDGATGANNPIRHMWLEAKDVWSSEPLENQLGCIVSIGTGVPTTSHCETKGIKGLMTLKEAATDTERIEKEFAQDHSELFENNRYFRFNVPDGLDKIGLEKVSKIDLIVNITQDYLARDVVHERIHTCAGSLDNVRSPSRPRSPKSSPWELTGLMRAQANIDQGKLLVTKLTNIVLYLSHLLIIQGYGESYELVQNPTHSCAVYEQTQCQPRTQKGKFLDLFRSRKYPVAV